MYDEERKMYLQNLNIETLRFWNNEVINNMDGVVEKIRLAMHSQKNNPLVSPLS